LSEGALLEEVPTAADVAKQKAEAAKDTA